MKKKSLIIIVCCMVLLTMALIIVHLALDKFDESNAVTLFYQGKEVTITLDKLAVVNFSGQLTNGKGEKTEASFTGIELRELLAEKNFDLSEVRYAEALAQDQYYARLSIEEILESGKVYIAVKKNDEALSGLQNNTRGAQLVIFGDPDSRRCVRYLENITLFDDKK
jgi:hypothetical protein